MALHWVFDSPRDRIVWDVGHQAYPHKLLTGRRDRFATIRQEGGLSGFLSRDESEHDAFGAGHASTSISAALGMAVAFAQRRELDRRVVAVIGDGALTGGMAFEALNNAGHPRSALHRHPQRQRDVDRAERRRDVAAISIASAPTRATTGPRTSSPRITERLPQGELCVELGKRWKDSLKEFIYHSMIWEELGFTYMGPVDGHDVRALVDALRQATQGPGPVFLHVVTEKGEGSPAAATDRERGHAVSRSGQAPGAPTVTAEVSGCLRADGHRARPATIRAIVAITAAMPTGTSLAKFQAGLSRIASSTSGSPSSMRSPLPRVWPREGMRPVVGIYSTFLQRAYDQIIHDVCIQTPAGDLRHGPRRVRRRRRPHPSRRLRPRLPALPART